MSNPINAKPGDRILALFDGFEERFTLQSIEQDGYLDTDGMLWRFVNTQFSLIPKAEPDAAKPFNASGSKYLREMKHLVDGKADVYAVLVAFDVTCPARQHAIKKLLCSGLRGKGDTLQDLKEARDAIDRAIQMEEQ